MRKALFIATLLSIQSIHAQYCETMYVAERCSTYALSMTNYTKTVVNDQVEFIPFYNLISPPYLYFTLTSDYNYIQMLNSKGDDHLGLRFPNERKIYRISTESIDKNLVTQRLTRGYIHEDRNNNFKNVFFVMDEQGYIAYGIYDEQEEFFGPDIYRIIETKALAPLQQKIREEKERTEREAQQKKRERNELVTRDPYAEVDNGDFNSYVNVIKTVEEYDNIIQNMTCPIVIQYDASWCTPGKRSLSYFFEKEAIKYSSEAKFYLINDNKNPFPKLNIYNGSTLLGHRSYGVSGLHEGDWDNLKKKWGANTIPYFIIIYNTNGDFISISSGFNNDKLSTKEEELADALKKAKSLFKGSR